MQDSNMFTDENASKLKQQRKKFVVQSQQQTPSDIGQEVAGVGPMIPRGLKRSHKSENSLKKVDSSRSPQDGLPESLSLTAKSDNEYRALRRKYLLLEEESFSVGKELEQIEIDVKNLEEEKYSLLDQLVVLEGLVDPPTGQKS